MLTCFAFSKPLTLRKTWLSLKSRGRSYITYILRPAVDALPVVDCPLLLLNLRFHHFLFIAASIILYSALSNVPVSSLCSDRAHDCITRYYNMGSGTPSSETTVNFQMTTFCFFIFFYLCCTVHSGTTFLEFINKGAESLSSVPR